MIEPQLVCLNGHAAGALDWRCGQCGAPIEIAHLPPFDAHAIRNGDWSLWRYGAMLPVEPRLTLGEGMTALTPVQMPDGEVYAKLEYLNPTGSYKDRGTVVLINHLIAHKVGEVVEDSSGNAGASLAAYAAAARIHARIFAPALAPAAKKRLIKQFADLVEVDGARSAPTAACHQAAQHTVYASHAWSPFFIAGQMTAAWEVWEQLGRRAPDALVCPVGHGGLFLGFARGFQMLHEAGLIDRLPKLYAVQAAACDPIVRGWESGADTPPVTEENQTLADGIVVNEPVRGVEVLRVIRDSGGMALRVSEDAIREALRTLIGRGLLVEPTSATAAAALHTVREHVGAGALIVMPLTGTGLKTLAS